MTNAERSMITDYLAANKVTPCPPALAWGVNTMPLTCKQIAADRRAFVAWTDEHATD